MAITWSGYVDRCRVGFEESRTGPHANGSVTHTINVYLNTNYGFFNYDGTATLRINGSNVRSGRIRLRNSDVMHVFTYTHTSWAAYDRAQSINIQVFGEIDPAPITHVSVGGSASVPRRPAAIPGPPRNPRASVSGRTITLKWEYPAEPRGCTINTYEIIQNNKVIATDPSGTWSKEFPPGTHSFYLRATGTGWNGGTFKGEGVNLSATVSGPPPPPPVVNETPAPPKLVALTFTDRVPKVTIVDGAGIYNVYSYKIQLYRQGSFSPLQVTAVTPPVLLWPLNEVNENGTYYVEVTAWHKTFESASTRSNTYILYDKTPTAPEGASIDDITGTSADVTGYFVRESYGRPIIETHYYVHETGTNVQVAQGVVPKLSTIHLDGLKRDTAYTVRLHAASDVGLSPGADVPFRTSTIAVARPDNLAAIRVGTAAQISWMPGGGESTEPVVGYFVEVDLSDDNKTLLYSGRVDGTSITVNGVPTSVQANIRVRALSVNGRSSWARFTLAPTTPGGGSPGTPGGEECPVWVNVGGTWQRAVAVWVNVSGTWQKGKVSVR